MFIKTYILTWYIWQSLVWASGVWRKEKWYNKASEWIELLSPLYAHSCHSDNPPHHYWSTALTFRRTHQGPKINGSASFFQVASGHHPYKLIQIATILDFIVTWNLSHTYLRTAIAYKYIGLLEFVYEGNIFRACSELVGLNTFYYMPVISVFLNVNAGYSVLLCRCGCLHFCYMLQLVIYLLFLYTYAIYEVTIAFPFYRWLNW
jgi:hypothetical protein